MRQAETDKLKIWIAGASGFCGRGITEALSSQDYKVYPHIRPSSRRAERLKAEWAKLDIDLVSAEWDDVDPILSQIQPDVIVTCLGTTKRHAKQGGGTYEEVDYGLNRRLLDIAETFERPPHLIYISSMGTEWGRWSAYLGARMRVERDLEASNSSYSIIRPGLLSGPSRDEKRTLEGVGTLISQGLCQLYQALGLVKLADKTRPLDAPEIGRFVSLLIERYAQGERTKDERRIYLVHEIHRALREGLSERS